ncbi:MAG: cellulase family glycosylhydrolase [Armatimonadota bacterium]
MKAILPIFLSFISAVMIVQSADTAATGKSEGQRRLVAGINQDLLWTEDAELDGVIKLIKESGATHVRIPVRWVSVEPSKGKWDFTKADRVIRKLKNADIKILGTLMSFPGWANGTEGKTVVGWYDTYAPESVDDWAEYVRRVVYRYKKEIHFWEIWNEENGVDFWRPEPDVKDYVRFLKSAYTACKSTDPKCTVVMGGLQMNGIIPNPWSPVKTPNYLQAIYDEGGKQYFDVINIHPYVLPRPEEGAVYMRKLVEGTIEVAEKNGDGKKPIWITEIGCGISDDDTAQEQAKLIEESFEAMASLPQIEAVYWFCLRDYPGSITGPEDSMGIVTLKGAKKPSFYAFQRSVRKHGIKVR